MIFLIINFIYQTLNTSFKIKQSVKIFKVSSIVELMISSLINCGNNYFFIKVSSMINEFIRRSNLFINMFSNINFIPTFSSKKLLPKVIYMMIIKLFPRINKNHIFISISISFCGQQESYIYIYKTQEACQVFVSSQYN